MSFVAAETRGIRKQSAIRYTVRKFARWRSKGWPVLQQAAVPLDRIYDGETRVMPSFFILLCSVDGLSPSKAAAPPGP